MQELAQLVEKLVRRLRLMFGNGIVPSRDPKKGYGSTYRDYFNYCIRARPVSREGTVEIDQEGGDTWQRICGHW